MDTQQATPDAPETEPSSTARRRRVTPAAAGLGLMVLAAGAFGVYEIGSSAGKHAAHSGACARSLDLAAVADPLVRGDVAAMTLASRPRPLGGLVLPPLPSWP